MVKSLNASLKREREEREKDGGYLFLFVLSSCPAGPLGPGRIGEW